VTGWALWEVFIRPRRGLSHSHVGSVHAPDAETALRNARDVYTRRQEGVSIWVTWQHRTRCVSDRSGDRADALSEGRRHKGGRHHERQHEQTRSTRRTHIGLLNYWRLLVS
jgi:ring-1,2-phenylacetyl-CoA epoxidase subunit PaaB